MGQMFVKTRHQMNNWRWNYLSAFGDQVDRSNPQTTSSGKGKRAGERFLSYGNDDFRARIEPPSSRQYKRGNFLAVKPLNWDEIIDEDDDDEHWADPGAPSGGRSHPGDDNDNDDGECEEDTQGGEKGTGKGKGTQDWKGKGKATEDGEGKVVERGKGGGRGRQTVKGKVLLNKPHGEMMSLVPLLCSCRGKVRDRLGLGGLTIASIFRAGSIARCVKFLR